MKRWLIGMNVKVNNFKRPGTKLHGARLLVEWKMRDVYWTCAPKRGWAVPGAGAVVINDDTRLVLFKSTAELTVRTVKASI